MTDEQAAIWDRISLFPLDAEGASHPYSAKLRKENRWPSLFTMRVIEEYRRFAFLSVVAGHMVSPSDAVDQAWHLHLFYTRSYWGEFCKNALGQPLHHNPSQGGSKEGGKFDDAYLQTLESYERFFGEAPPSDIWPPVAQKNVERHDYSRVDRASHWVIPKLKLRPWLPHAISGVLAFVLIGCSSQTGSFNPFDFDGPGFLDFYACVFGACTVCALVVRSLARLPGGAEGPGLPPLTPLETAELAVGEYGSIRATLAGLVVCGYLKVDPVMRTVETVNNDTTGLDPLAAHIVTDCYGAGQTMTRLRTMTELSLQAIRDRLVQRRLLLGQGDRLRQGLLSSFIAAIPLGIGIPRLIGGIGLGHPVGFLILFSLATAVVAAAFCVAPPRR